MEPGQQPWQVLSGLPAARQLRVINRRHTRDQRDIPAVRTVIWGTRPRPAIEQAIGADAASGDWPARLADALIPFARLPWPRKLLIRPASRPARQRERQSASE